MRAPGGTTPRLFVSAIGRRAAPRITARRRWPPMPSSRPIRSATGIRAGRFAATSSRTASSKRRCERSQAAAVERGDVDGGEGDVVEAAYVDGDHLGAAPRGRPARERADAALAAAHVVDGPLAELIVLDVVGARA